MHEKLRELDPETAQRLHENDEKRIVRALEIILTTGKTLAQSSDKKETPDVIMVALDTDRQKLYERINERVDKMFDMGLVDEVYSVGSFAYQSMQAIGYKEFAPYEPQYNDGHFTLSTQEIAEIKDKIKQHTRNYAKRQLTWFRKYDFIKWFDVNEQDKAIEYIENQINNKICRENATEQA